MKRTIPFYFFLVAFITIVSQAIGDPGDFYKQRYKELVAQFDTDGDGFLDAKERAKMRVTPKPKGKGFRRGGEKQDNNRVRRDMPQHWIEKYDKDGDGGLSDKEADKGFWTEKGLLFKKYDQNRNEKLEKQEAEKLAKDIKDGKFESWDYFVATTTLKDATPKDRKRRSNLSPQQQEWLKHDLDGDGIASEQEVAAIRKSKK
ncbi:hypothetical protein OAM01_01045 [bacterium]|nr:hypothetical protein [bacterium]